MLEMHNLKNLKLFAFKQNSNLLIQYKHLFIIITQMPIHLYIFFL